MSTWTIYDHPLDYPHHYVAREFIISPDGQVRASESIMIADDLELLRERLLIDFGKVALARSPEDDPVIVETWV